MHFDEMLRVDKCRDMDELINFWARSGCRNRIAFSDIVYALLRRILRRQNPGAPLQRAVVLKWLYLLRRRDTFSEVNALYRVSF